MEKLQNKLAGIITEYNNTLEYYKNTLNDLFAEYMFGWTISYMSGSNISIGFKYGDDYTQNLDIYFDRKTRYINKTWQRDEHVTVDINPGCFGAFAITDENTREYTYYTGVATILTNKEFSNKLVNIITEVYNKLETLNNIKYDIKDEIRNKENEIKTQEEIAKANEQAKDLNNYKYAIISYSNRGRFIYRKRNVNIILLTNDLYEANMTKYNKRIDCKVIETSKVKLMA